MTERDHRPSDLSPQSSVLSPQSSVLSPQSISPSVLSPSEFHQSFRVPQSFLNFGEGYTAMIREDDSCSGRLPGDLCPLRCGLSGSGLGPGPGGFSGSGRREPDPDSRERDRDWLVADRSAVRLRQILPALGLRPSTTTPRPPAGSNLGTTNPDLKQEDWPSEPMP